MVGLDIKGILREGSRYPFSLLASTQRHWPKLTLMNAIFYLRNRGCGVLWMWAGKSLAWAPGSMNNCGLSKSHGPHCLHGRELTFDGDGEDEDENI